MLHIRQPFFAASSASENTGFLFLDKNGDFLTYTGTELPFIASICISTIQLGATVDYAILMTTRYKTERYAGKNKHESIWIAHSTSMPSVVVSALSFFAATFGVGIYSDIDIISSLCTLMARGAIVSLLVVMFILPSAFMIFDKLIIKTSKGFINKGGNADALPESDPASGGQAQ